MSLSQSSEINLTDNGKQALNAKKLANGAQSTAETAQALANGAQKTADGKNSVYRGSDPNSLPTAGLKAGDLYFTDNAVYTWTGTAWEKTVSDTTGTEIHAKVEAAMQESQKSVADLKTDVESKVSEIDSNLSATTTDLTNVKADLVDTKNNLSTTANDLKDGLSAVNSDLSATKTSLADTRNSLATTASDLSNVKTSLADTQSSLATTANDLTNVKVDLADTKNNLTTTTNDIKTSLAAVSNDLSATKTNLEDTKNSFSTTVADLQKQTGQLSGSLETANSNIEYNSNAIAEVKHTADGISTTISSGGRNLIPQAGNFSTDYWTIASGGNGQGLINKLDVTLPDSLKSDNMFTILNNTQGNRDWATTTYDVNVVKGRTYTFSVYVKLNNVTNCPDPTIQFRMWGKNVGLTWGVARKGLGLSKTAWKRVSFTAMASNSDFSRPAFGIIDYGSIDFAFPQFEVGGMATPWQPSGNDISMLRQTANAIRVDLTNTKGDVASVKATANSLQSQITDNKSNISSVKQTADSLTSTVGQMPAQWQQAINDKASAQVLTSNVDMSNLTTAGTYLIKDFNVKNAPVGAYFMATVEATSDSARVVQRVKKDNANTAYERSKNPDGWTNWERIATGTDVSSIKQTMDGITTRVSNAEGNVSSLQQTASGLQTVVSDNVKNISSVKQTADSLTTRMSSAEGNVNSLQQTASKLQSDLTNAKGDISGLQQTASGFNSYVKESKGSKTLAAILSMDPNNSTIAQVVNGHVVAAINTSSDGSVKIDGKTLHITADTKIENAVIKSAMIDSIDASKITTGELDASHIKVVNLDANSITTGRLSGRNIELDGNTTVTGRLDLMQKNTNWISQNTNYHNNWSWNNAHIYFDNYLQLLGENCNVTYSNDNSHLNGGSSFYSITTLTPGYLKFTTYQTKVDITDEKFDGQIVRTYIDSSRIEANDVWAGDLRIVGHHIRPADDKFVMISNHAGTNFDNNGSVGFQVYGGVGLGKNTIYTATTDLYIQNGNAVQNLGQSYGSANKTTIHAKKLISQVANTVSSRLSVKTDITPVSYDRALAAVEDTDMYDYRYIDDDSGQHYVSGIIDDVNTDPQYHMDGMLINKERTARIDANLIGYHHVVIQKLLERIDTLEINNQQLVDRVATLEEKIK